MTRALGGDSKNDSTVAGKHRVRKKTSYEDRQAEQRRLRSAVDELESIQRRNREDRDAKKAIADEQAAAGAEAAYAAARRRRLW